MFRIILLFFAIVIIIDGFFIEPYQVGVTTLDFREKKVGSQMKGLVAVHLTDLHIRKMGSREKQVISMIRELNPDLIFLTGDFVKWRGDYAPAMAFLKELHARHGVFAVLGDYDTSDSRKSCLFCHDNGDYTLRNSTHGVRFLRNQILSIQADKRVIHIGGIGFMEDEEKKTIHQMNQTCPEIILSHNPLCFDLVSDSCETLVLSGDTHGGQVSLPSWAWRIIGYEKNERYNQGLFSMENKRMFVSRGIGTSHLPFRLFNQPEVVVIYF